MKIKIPPTKKGKNGKWKVEKRSKTKCPACGWTIQWPYEPWESQELQTLRQHITINAKKELWDGEFEKGQRLHLKFFRKNKVVRVETVKKYTIDYKGLK